MISRARVGVCVQGEGRPNTLDVRVGPGFVGNIPTTAQMMASPDIYDQLARCLLSVIDEPTTVSRVKFLYRFSANAERLRYASLFGRFHG